jgi:benzodiazapine receptor
MHRYGELMGRRCEALESNPRMKQKKGSPISSLIVFFVLVAVAATLGSVFEPGAWYDALAKPEWTPPNWLFPVTWTILYVMIAIAGWLVWKQAGWSTAIFAWTIGLALNAFWTYVMFGLHRVDLALIEVLFLLASIIAFMILARRLDGRATLLFAPYLMWVSIATALNTAILLMNP